MPDAIEREVIEIIARKKKLDPSTLSAATTFEDLGLDSLDAADLIFTVEDTFKIVVPDEAAANMKSVAQVAAGIAELVANRTGAR